MRNMTGLLLGHLYGGSSEMNVSLLGKGLAPPTNGIPLPNGSTFPAPASRLFHGVIMSAFMDGQCVSCVLYSSCSIVLSFCYGPNSYVNA